MYKVAQCWDDGVASDIIVAELCRRYGAKATFNLNPGKAEKGRRRLGGNFKGFDVYLLSQSEYPSVYEGFELASHTMNHPHPTAITPEEFRHEAVDARKYIEDMRQREAAGFAWPYGDRNAACVDILREEGFCYGRATEKVTAVLPCAEPLELPVNCHFLDPDFEKIRAASKASGCFYFWGHSYEMKDDPRLRGAYENILRAIASDQDAVWVDVIDLVAPGRNS